MIHILGSMNRVWNTFLHGLLLWQHGSTIIEQYHKAASITSNLSKPLLHFDVLCMYFKAKYTMYKISVLVQRSKSKHTILLNLDCNEFTWKLQACDWKLWSNFVLGTKYGNIYMYQSSKNLQNNGNKLSYINYFSFKHNVFYYELA